MVQIGQHNDSTGNPPPCFAQILRLRGGGVPRVICPDRVMRGKERIVFGVRIATLFLRNVLWTPALWLLSNLRIRIPVLKSKIELQLCSVNSKNPFEEEKEMDDRASNFLENVPPIPDHSDFADDECSTKLFVSFQIQSRSQAVQIVTNTWEILKKVNSKSYRT